MDPAVAALELAEAGVVIANMIESYLAGGAPLPNLEGADHDELENCGPSSLAVGLHHSSVDAGLGVVGNSLGGDTCIQRRTATSGWNVRPGERES